MAQLTPSVFAERPVMVKAGGEFYVRSIQRANADGSLTFFCAIDEGVVLRLAGHTDIVVQLHGLFGAIRANIGPPELVIGFDCVLRNLEAERRQLRHAAGRILLAHSRPPPGAIVTMTFLRDNGDEVEESMVNTGRPYELLLPYARYMFASYLFVPQPRRVLIVGLGGGAMVQFLTHFDPQATVDVVEIDPVVVSLAQRYFGQAQPGGEHHHRRRAEVPGRNNAALRRDLHGRLPQTGGRHRRDGRSPASEDRAVLQEGPREARAGGLVSFNLNQHAGTLGDIAAIQAAFRQVYVFRPPVANVVVIASSAATREALPVLVARANEADRRMAPGFSLHDLLGRLTP